MRNTKGQTNHQATLALVGLGLVAGTMGGLLGIGGGVLIVPGLVFLVCFDQHKAHGTSLVSALALALAGLLRYSHDGNVDWRLALGIAAGGIVGAIFGARAANAVNATVLRRIFAAFLLIVSIRMVLTGMDEASHSPATALLLSPNMPAYWAVAVVTGLVTGFVSGMLGVGGGVVMIPAMVLLVGVSQKTAQGISLAAMIPTALSGIRVHRSAGNVDLRVGKWTALGAAGGALIGATAASHLANSVLQFAFAGFLVFTALVMIYRKNGKR